MLVIANFVNELERKRLLRAQRFIEQSAELSYCIAPEGDPRGGSDFSITARYSDSLFYSWDYLTKLEINTIRKIDLEASLTDLVILICFLADHPEFLQYLDGAPLSDEEDIVRSFGIDPASVCRPSVKAWAPGDFIAPDGNMFMYFSVSPRGDVSVVSRSSDIYSIAFHYTAHQLVEETGLVTRISQVKLP